MIQERQKRPELSGRDLHLVKKALAIATLAIEQRPGPFQSTSDQADMKSLLDQMIKSDVELEYYGRRAARIAVIGGPAILIGRVGLK